MTVKEIRKLLRGLDPNMQLVMLDEENNIVTVCSEGSEIITAETKNGHEVVLLLQPCTNACMIDDIVGDINLN